jgi:hypothetical protein
MVVVGRLLGLTGETVQYSVLVQQAVVSASDVGVCAWSSRSGRETITPTLEPSPPLGAPEPLRSEVFPEDSEQSHACLLMTSHSSCRERASNESAPSRTVDAVPSRATHMFRSFYRPWANKRRASHDVGFASACGDTSGATRGEAVAEGRLHAGWRHADHQPSSPGLPGGADDGIGPG